MEYRATSQLTMWVNRKYFKLHPYKWFAFPESNWIFSERDGGRLVHTDQEEIANNIFIWGRTGSFTFILFTCSPFRLHTNSSHAAPIRNMQLPRKFSEKDKIQINLCLRKVNSCSAMEFEGPLLISMYNTRISRWRAYTNLFGKLQ